MKNKSIYLIILLILILLTISCSNQDDFVYGERTYLDFMDTNQIIAVEAGDSYGELARDLFKAREIPEFTSVADILESLRLGRIDAGMISEEYVKQLQDSGMYPNVEYLWIPKDVYVHKAANIFQTTQLRDQFNLWLSDIKADGTFDEIRNRWIGVSLPREEDIPRFEFTGENGILRVADTGNYPPLVYFDSNNEPVGFDIEIVSRFAIAIGKRPVWSMMAYDGIAPYILSGRADMSSATLAVTRERSEQMLFGEPTVITQTVLIVQKGKRVIGNTLDPNDDIVSYFSDQVLACPLGSIFDVVIEDNFNQTPRYYSTVSTALEDLRKGRIDGYMDDLSSMRIITSFPENRDLKVYPVPDSIFISPTAAFSTNQSIIDSFNLFLEFIEADGTLADMRERWLLNVPDPNTPMPDIPQIPISQNLRVLRVATSLDVLPFAFSGNNGVEKGYSIEMVQRYAAHVGRPIQIIDMEFAAVIPFVVSNRADLGIGNFSITEERKQMVIFTDPVFTDQSAIVVFDENQMGNILGNERFSFKAWIKIGVQRNLITDNRYKMVLDGLKVTMIIALLAQIFGTIFGGFVCYILLRKQSFISGFGKFYCGLINGTPMVVLLMITYYIIFGNTMISNVFVAVMAFTMMTGAGVAQILKGAIDTIDPVEIEAARSLGFSAFRTFIRVTLPQAIKRALPAYTKSFVELVKATAIVGYIAIQDLTRAGDIIRSRTYDAYFPLLFVALIYLTVTTICVVLFKYIVQKISAGGN